MDRLAAVGRRRRPPSRNPHTRRAYARTIAAFLDWCRTRGVAKIVDVRPLHVSAWIEARTQTHSAPTVKQALAAIRHLFDWLVVGQIVSANPAAAVLGTDELTATPLPQANAYAMIQLLAKREGLKTKIGNHSFRATGITTYLKNSGTLEKAAAMANHASTRTTQLYDRRSDDISLDEVERVLI